MGATPLCPANTLDCSVGVGTYIAWDFGECSQGGNPNGVLYCCHVSTCTCAIVLGAAIGVLTLPCKLISSSSTIFTMGWPLICHSVPKVRYGTTMVSASLHKPQLRLLSLTTCKLLKYYNQFCVARSFIGSFSHSAWFLSFLSSVFMLSPASITIELRVLHWTIASCMLATRPMFLESSSHTAYTVFSSSLECHQKLQNQFCVVQGLTKACRLVACLLRIVGSQLHSCQTSYFFSPYLRHCARTD